MNSYIISCEIIPWWEFQNVSINHWYGQRSEFGEKPIIIKKAFQSASADKCKYLKNLEQKFEFCSNQWR